MSYEKLLSDLRDVWRQEGIEPAGPASSEEIAAFEAQHVVRLPDDLRAYFATLNGFKDGQSGPMDDQRMVVFWRLDELERRSYPGGPDDVFYFADFLVSSHSFGIVLTPEATSNPVFIDWGTVILQCAPSFTDFVEGYLKNDPYVLMAPSDPA